MLSNALIELRDSLDTRIPQQCASWLMGWKALLITKILNKDPRLRLFNAEV